MTKPNIVYILADEPAVVEELKDKLERIKNGEQTRSGTAGEELTK